MSRKFYTFLYVFFDFIAASLSWACFYIYRKEFIETYKYGHKVAITFDRNFFIGISLIPLAWVFVYFLYGAYFNVFRRSRLKELGQTFYISLLGCLAIFFLLLLDDQVISYKTYYRSFFTLFCLHFSITAIVRFIISTRIARAIQKRKIGFNTIIIGSSQNAVNLYHEVNNQEIKQGNLFVGFIYAGTNGGQLETHIPKLGGINNLKRIIQEYQVEEVLIAIESSEHKNIGEILNTLEDSKVIVKIIPDIYDILSGSVKMTAIFGAPLIEISPVLMPEWQKSLKRLLDILASILVFVIFSPVFIVTALIVKLTSDGPIFYSHERIGLYGKPFRIFKFRSMLVDAEKNGPMLSSKTDSRVTPFGRMMRKTRLDEIPQFYNVLIGDMSIVGPRPERQFYIDQIMLKAPHYKHLHKVRPGITSWGQVKYGYAENVDQMVARLKYDVIYIENMSLALDLKILIYTILIVLQGRGK